MVSKVFEPLKFYCISFFFSAHDFKFLKNLSEAGGTAAGMFRYCESSDDKQALKYKLDELFDFILDL